MADSELRNIISSYPKDQRENLIPILQDLQDEYGYLPESAIYDLADHLSIPVVKIYSVATYYNQFHFEPLGKYHLQVCAVTACHLEGGNRLIKEIQRILEIEDGDITKDHMFSLELVPCLGACHLAPVININGELYGELNTRKLTELLDKIRNS